MTLREIVGAFPAHFEAIVCIVLHIPPWSPSALPAILSAAGALPAVHPTNFERLEHGHIYVAQPDQHLMIDGDRAFVWHGPRENQHRPSINVLFRSAAVMAGPRVVGVVLSGALDDGATGLSHTDSNALKFGWVSNVDDESTGARGCAVLKLEPADDLFVRTAKLFPNDVQGRRERV